jgi:hypothetical protein
MAHERHQSPIGDDKLPDEHLDGAQGDNEAATEDYDVERVEKVYRKLDWRIIPGLLAH